MYEDENLFRLLDRALFGASEQLPKSRPFQKMADMNFTVKQHEPGTAANLVLPGKKCRKFHSKSRCSFDYFKDTQNPYISFKVSRQVPDESNFTTVIDVSREGKKLTQINMNCRLCGPPCPFEAVGHKMLWKMRACPLGTYWKTPLDMLGVSFAPKGIFVKINTQNFRKRKPSLAYALNVMF